MGPTGVGKTELAKALAELMFGSEEALLQFDMSEFMERHAVARLVGAPPGYIGYEDAGQLTETIRRHPYSVVCFDEIEKAHPEAVNMLLQIMEDGHLSDARGHKVDFRNAIIIMTTNLGVEQLKRGGQIGFSHAQDEDSGQKQAYGQMKDKLMDELKRHFRPEFLNRVDEIVVFHSLSRAQIYEIVSMNLDYVQRRLDEYRIRLQATDKAKELLAQKGYDPQFGARPLRRTVQRLVEDPLSEGILGGRFKHGDTVQIDDEEGEIVLRVCEPVGPLEKVKSLLS